MQLKLLIQQIQFIEAQVADIEQEIGFVLEKLNSPIMTIPGIGPVNGACILGEIGDISRFSNAAKLAALIATFHAPVFSAFYQKKRAEGKHHLTAIGAVARKLCNVIFAILKNNEPYRTQAL